MRLMHGWLLAALWAAGCTAAPNVPEGLGKLANAPDPFLGPGKDPNRIPPLAVGPSADAVKPGTNGVNMEAPSVRGGERAPGSSATPGPARLTTGDRSERPVRKENDLAIDNPPTVVPRDPRRDTNVRRAAWDLNAGLAWESAQERLRAAGVVRQRLEMRDDGRWLFQCSCMDPAQPNRLKNYEAVADDGLAAIQAVLDAMPGR